MDRPMRTIAGAALVLLTATATATAGSGGSGSGSGNGSGSGSGNDEDVIRALACSGSGSGKLKLDREDGNRVETEFELQHVSANRRWRIQFRHNGTLVTNVVRTTTATGRIELRRLLVDRTGADRVSVVAQRLPSGQRCTASGLAP